MALPTTSFQPTLVLLHQSLLPLTVGKSPRPVPAPSSQLPHSTSGKPTFSTHGMGCSTLPSTVRFLASNSCPRVFSFHERQDFLSCLEAKRLEIYLSIFTFTHLLTHPLSYSLSWVSIHTSFPPPFIHIHSCTHLFIHSFVHLFIIYLSIQLLHS